MYFIVSFTGLEGKIENECREVGKCVKYIFKNCNENVKGK